MFYQSKWGWHPCDYNGFLKLKKVYKAYWEGRHLLAKFERWERKQPQNRPQKPEFSSVYYLICRSDIVELFRQARMPTAKENVIPINSHQWKEIEDWLNRLDESSALVTN
jgi:fructose-1,6-bisphosphatase